MELLDRLKEQYEWQDVKFVNEQLVETELGRKRVRYWTDKALLDWHIAWRDGCSVTPYMQTDRMIRNKDQQAWIDWKEGWLTVHDEVDNSFRLNQSDQKVGQMIGTMIAYGLRANPELDPAKPKEPLFQTAFNHLSALKEEQRILIRSLIKESDVRMRKAKALTADKKEQLPILDPLTSIDQAQTIHQIFLWFGSTNQPERGYYSLRSFLLKWLETNGTESLQALLEELFNNQAMTRDQAILLLAECLKPYELDRLVREMTKGTEQQQIEETIEAVTKEWEQSKELVQKLSVLIDSKKKVLTT